MPSRLVRESLIRTPDRRLRVFISSTLNELAEERRAAREAVERLRLSPIMFELGARPHAPRQLYRAYLEQSDVFLGIYWQEYGWVAANEPVSGLEDEYRLSGPRPRLIYVKSPAPRRDPRLGALLEQIRGDDRASYKPFRSVDELRELVENDLAVLLSERFEQIADAARTAGSRLPQGNVPVPRNQLIGRAAELASTCDLLRGTEASLVTLVGPGGAGKSRLGLQAALDLRTDFPEGVYLVALESIRDPELVVPAIMRALEIPELPETAPFDVLVGQLDGSRVLLLLDNFEQVVGAAPSVSMLLERCPGLKVLVTSRTPLRIRGERRLAVPPLAVPEGQRPRNLDSLSQYAAVALFIERATAIDPTFRVSNQTAPAVAEICHRLDGLPLAIELAAARIGFLPPEAMLDHFGRGLDLLRGGTRDLPDRHRTMRGAIGWSYDLLAESTRATFRRLAAFAGDWSLDDAVVVCGDCDEPLAILDDMEQLVEASLIHRAEIPGAGGADLAAGAGSAARFGMLETIREFATEQLAESGELDGTMRRAASLYVELVERANPELRAADQVAWADRLELERINIRGVLTWSRDQAPETGLRLSASLWRFWEMRGSVEEGRTWLETLLALTGPDAEGRSRALSGAAATAAYQGDYEAMRRHTEELLDLSRRRGDRRGTATALNELGLAAAYQSDLDSARQLLEESLAIKLEIGDRWLLGNAYTNLGLVAAYGGDLETARSRHEDGLAAFRAVGDALGVAIALGNLGHVAARQGRLADARVLQGDSLRAFDQVGDVDGFAESLERHAMLAVAEGDALRAAWLFGAAEHFAGASGTLRQPFERRERDTAVADLRASLPEAAFEAAWVAGGSLSRADVASLALEPAAGPAGPSPSMADATRVEIGK